MKIATLLLAAAALALPLFAQQSISIITEPTQMVLNYTATLLTSTCTARSIVTTGPRASTKVAITTVSKASAAVVTSTAHGFAASSRPSVTVSGATGTGWTAINASWTATVTGADTFTIPIDSTTFGTLAGTVVFTTTAPRAGVPEWQVKKYAYDGSSNLIWTGWLGGTPAFNWKCSDAGSTTLQQQ